ncbi:DUF2281 domain-containing protein [Synechocystis sp. PCC 6714]|uniref:DUF2281 domain-containing protein n=1 Tax=Synechocystis sp. (strain PCC 6714) TaxID=1147 RepID=UPI0004111724|nr:DUF2281 domain-containing protein [Synechocystis sp. PCC 6714]AIE76131.1 hypothetical protein D082_40850 [Synechocystis sp. PCC 6714]
MNLTQAILQEIQDLPDDKQQEVLDFTRFLKSKPASSSAPPRPSLFGSDRDKIHFPTEWWQTVSVIRAEIEETGEGLVDDSFLVDLRDRQPGRDVVL